MVAHFSVKFYMPGSSASRMPVSQRTWQGAAVVQIGGKPLSGSDTWTKSEADGVDWPSVMAWPPWQSHWWKFIKAQRKVYLFQERLAEMPWLHLQLSTRPGNTAGQQRLKMWNKKVENQTQKFRLLPFRPRCRCLYGSAFNRRDNQEARQLALQRNPRPFLNGDYIGASAE